ncbi:MAG: hypothetical protein R3E79_18585 [Caldilineaceae bacterium]
MTVQRAKAKRRVKAFQLRQTKKIERTLGVGQPRPGTNACPIPSPRRSAATTKEANSVGAVAVPFNLPNADHLSFLFGDKKAGCRLMRVVIPGASNVESRCGQLPLLGE